MQTLSRELRRNLENTVREARRIAEAGARKVIEELGVNHHEPWPGMAREQRDLRNRLRAHGRQLGDRRDERRGVQAIDRLTTECAFEHWHRMLFARYLAETELLIEPESGVAISLAECQELARAGGRDWQELAAEYAQRMLPQIFRSGDPVLEVALPPETRSVLEDLMKSLPSKVYLADDSLGWVYQYWQADRKEAVNRSEKKIGAEELPAVTQLFTEDYMVFFLLHNTLGAWWAGKVLAANPALAATAGSEDELRAACAVGGVDWTYLRFVREGDQPWRPAAGTFSGWPKAAKDITLLDPCMGSGHFLVFALPMLTALRAREEGISLETATLGVLRDNLFGLEIDPRCTQIAAFNLALAAWRRIGYRALPAPHLACSGLPLGVNKAEWLKLAARAATELPVPPKTDLLGTEDNLFSDAMKRGFERLYDLFARAPWLGSLIDPRAAGGDLVEYGFGDLEPILVQVMAKADNAELAEMAVAAQGLAKASEILAKRFTLVATNVPYLGRGKQDEVLRDYCEGQHIESKADLATCFVERCLDYCEEGGSTLLVTPQTWLFLGVFKKLRRKLLEQTEWNMVARLGPAAFQDMNWWAATTLLSGLTRRVPVEATAYFSVDASAPRETRLKPGLLDSGSVRLVLQKSQLENPDHTVSDESIDQSKILKAFATSNQGIGTADTNRYVCRFWELASPTSEWSFYQMAPERNALVSGCHSLLRWESGLGSLAQSPQARVCGQPAWGKVGIAVSVTGHLYRSLYLGTHFDCTAAAITSKDAADSLAITACLLDEQFPQAVRSVDQALSVTESSFLKIEFQSARWTDAARKLFPGGHLKIESTDPTQWILTGHPKDSVAPLHVAAARLLGFRWPRQTGSLFSQCPALMEDGLERHADHDGIVTVSPVKGEQSASGRLTALLADAYGAEWSAARLNSMLVEGGYAGETLDDWLRDGFFEQHCAVFHQRPFVWHIWDGRRDGFHALVNYHRLAAPNGEGRRTLEKLLYTYLGDWIDRQRADQTAGVEGADARVAAADQLKTELTNILAGEPPYDIFVRWKQLSDQPIGWEPDINDGVRMNIRPFMAAKPLGARARGACILRTTPKIKWEKDRGKEPQRPREDFPWFWGWDERTENFEGTKTFDGNRWNDLHYTRAFKEAARAKGKK
ncbi:MAG: SAM-dependent methyltransferase [Betaproteobacteria bacterium]|nr:SAM-dependent methyltransferase [Betaproteobacteria bacterium]